MGPSPVPAPDDVVVSLLASVFGPAALVVLLFQAVSALAAWAGVVRTGHRLGVATLFAAKDFRAQMLANSKRGPAIRAFAVLGSVLAIVTWVYLSYVMGNGASYFLFGRIPLSGPELGAFLEWRRLDPVTAYFTYGAIGIGAWSLTRGMKGHTRGGASWPLWLPWMIFGTVMAVGTVIGTASAFPRWRAGQGFTYDVFGVAVSPLDHLVLVLASLGYYAASRAANAAPAVAAKLVRAR